MSTYKQYTGTFRKADGTTRTMSFIKTSDLPYTHFSSNQIKGNKSRDGKTEVVWDTKLRDFRRFNHSTVVGTVVSENVKYSFDS
tara:strand:+ start:782 stop:1033 length:252 start_codon:yes stop_codon:yes gene_type:complete